MVCLPLIRVLVLFDWIVPFWACIVTFAGALLFKLPFRATWANQGAFLRWNTILKWCTDVLPIASSRVENCGGWLNRIKTTAQIKKKAQEGVAYSFLCPFCLRYSFNRISELVSRITFYLLLAWPETDCFCMRVTQSTILTWRIYANGSKKVK